MTTDLIEAKIATMEEDIRDIKADIKNMPEMIAEKVNTNIDLKIKLAISETEKKYQSKLIGLLIAIVGEAIALIVKFVMG